MSMKHLGERFDVHTGGNDNKFPHHEDEIAQSEGATGHQVVSIWVHGGFLQLSGQKMAKSARNIKRVIDIAEAGLDPLSFRLLCFGTRYRSEMEFSWEALEGASARLASLRQRMADWADQPGNGFAGGEREELDRRFRHAVATDLDMPQALVVLNEAAASPALSPGDKQSLLASWDAVLGLDLGRLARQRWQPSADIQELIRRRDEARNRKDYETSDGLRDELSSMGLEVMDTPDGTKVRPRA